MALSESAVTRSKALLPSGKVPVVAHRAGDLRCAAVHFALGHSGQLLVGRLFLLKVLLKQSRAIVAAQLFRPRDQGAVARDLVVLNGLRRSNERGIQNRLVPDLAGNLFCLVDDAVNGGGIRPTPASSGPV